MEKIIIEKVTLKKGDSLFIPPFIGIMLQDITKVFPCFRNIHEKIFLL